MSLRGTLLVVCALFAATGCATWQRPDQEFYGRYIILPGHLPVNEKRPLTLSKQDGGVITAQGATHPLFDRQRLTLRLANHGVEAVPMSYVVDEYIATTFDRRTLTLEKDDFFTYPQVLKPGDAREVTLLLPEDAPAREIAQILVTINNGTTTIPLKPILPRFAATMPPQREWWQSIVQPQPKLGEAWVPLLESSAQVPFVPEPTDAPASMTEPPLGAIPVTVEFQQEFGSMLKVHLRWDEAGTVTTLAHNDHRIFYVVPGQHVLYLTSHLSSLDEGGTMGSLPVRVGAAYPLRIRVDGRARFAGVELRARIWYGDTLVFDQALEPDPETSLTP